MRIVFFKKLCYTKENTTGNPDGLPERVDKPYFAKNFILI